MEYVTLANYVLCDHDIYAPNKNLFDPYWIKGYDFSISYSWLENHLTCDDYSFKNVSDFIDNATPEILNDIYKKASIAFVVKRPFLYYMSSKTVDDVPNSNTRDLLRDAYNCLTLTDTLGSYQPKEYAKEAMQKYPEEFQALTNLRCAIERELRNRLSNTVNVAEAHEDAHCYIEFLSESDTKMVEHMKLGYMYLDLYKLYDFFDNVKQPKKKSATNEYKFCGLMKDALERNILSRLRWA